MNQNLENIHLSDFTYTLPEDRIAHFPLEKRDDAKLQVYIEGEISHTQFFNLHYFLPKDALLVFNNTKVVPARLHFKRITGAVIEVFLLHPHQPGLVSLAMQSTQACSWECLIGNKKRWKSEEILMQKLVIQDQEILLTAKLIDREKDVVRLSWEVNQLTFADILQAFGELPLPPYLHRKATEADFDQYQTVYSEPLGAVAAPTAGLHFTAEVFDDLLKKGIQTEFLTLHVGGGTFQPIKTAQVINHPMHAEQMIFTQQNVENFLKNAENIVAVGTTSMRALESLYWFGVKLAQREGRFTDLMPFRIEKLFPYSVAEEEQITLEASFQVISDYMRVHQLPELIGETEIFMFPTYQFKVCKGLITNYHLPNTTLIMLVAAFIGEDWRKVYQEALDKGYRFLSYGDSSLLIPAL
jgi:S-adenosylmethionine:tRNA ribosyltransferase-isomerase